jgi:asparagine synthetase A
MPQTNANLIWKIADLAKSDRLYLIVKEFAAVDLHPVGACMADRRRHRRRTPHHSQRGPTRAGVSAEGSDVSGPHHPDHPCGGMGDFSNSGH